MANASVATVSGRTIIWRRMMGAGTEAKNLKWGTGTVTASAATDVALFTPATETGVAGTSSIVNTSALWALGDTYKVTGTITCLVAGKTITEMELSDVITLSGTTTIAGSSQAAGATTVTLTLGSAVSIPTTGNFYIQVENEVEIVTGGQGSNIFTVGRGALGSTSVAHAIGVSVTVGGDGGASAVALGAQTATIDAAHGGNNFCHADFGAIVLATNDSILFSVTDQLT